MEEKNELNDIILSRSSTPGGGKKVLMAIATLAIILIIVVVIMNRLNSEGTDNLPQAVLPPEPTSVPAIAKEDPLFEPVEVIEEKAPSEDNLDRIAQKLREESMAETTAEVPVEPVTPAEEEPVAVEPVAAEPVAPAPVAVKPAAPKPAAAKPATIAPAKPAAAVSGKYYVQVGSFTKFEPNERFLKTITDNGYSYTYQKVTRNGQTINKVLVGPFGSEKEARAALPNIRKKIESGAFLTKV